ADQHRGGEPGVLAPRPGGGEGACEPDLFGRPGDLGQVADRGRAHAARRADADAVAAADELAAVAVGGQEPVSGQGHEGSLLAGRAEKASPMQPGGGANANVGNRPDIVVPPCGRGPELSRQIGVMSVAKTSEL